MPKKKKTQIVFKDKVVSYLKVREGDSKVKVYDKEQKKKVETGGMRHWRCQEFSISLDPGCGYAPVEYWGAETLLDGSIIEIGLYHLKQKTWTTKDPVTFKETKHSSLVLILDEVSKVANKSEAKTQEELVSVNEEMKTFEAEIKEEKEEYKLPELE